MISEVSNPAKTAIRSQLTARTHLVKYKASNPSAKFPHPHHLQPVRRELRYLNNKRLLQHSLVRSEKDSKIAVYQAMNQLKK